MSNQIEQIPAEIKREMQETAELAPCCDFCHESDILDREEWCKEKFRHFYAAGMLAERERLMKEAVEIEVSNVGILEMGKGTLRDRGIQAGDTIKLIILK